MTLFSHSSQGEIQTEAPASTTPAALVPPLLRLYLGRQAANFLAQMPTAKKEMERAGPALAGSEQSQRQPHRSQQPSPVLPTTCNYFLLRQKANTHKKKEKKII